MIDYETYLKIKNYHENDGLNCSQIAGITGLDYKTLKRHSTVGFSKFDLKTRCAVRGSGRPF